MSDRVTVPLSIEVESLDTLIEGGGDYVLRVWMSREGGAYRLHATAPADASTEALLRVICGTAAFDAPDPLPPSPEVAEQMERWNAWLERLRTEQPA